MSGEPRSPDLAGLITLEGKIEPGPAGCIIFQNYRARVFLDPRLIVIPPDRRSVILRASMAKAKNLI